MESLSIFSQWKSKCTATFILKHCYSAFSVTNHVVVNGIQTISLTFPTLFQWQTCKFYSPLTAPCSASRCVLHHDKPLALEIVLPSLALSLSVIPSLCLSLTFLLLYLLRVAEPSYGRSSLPECFIGSNKSL